MRVHVKLVGLGCPVVITHHRVVYLARGIGYLGGYAERGGGCWVAHVRQHHCVYLGGRPYCRVYVRATRVCLYAALWLTIYATQWVGGRYEGERGWHNGDDVTILQVISCEIVVECEISNPVHHPARHTHP